MSRACGCCDIERSYYYMQANATVTTIAVVDTPVKVAGTTTSSVSTTGFTNSDNRATYNSSKGDLFSVHAVLNITGTASDQFTLYIAKNGTIIAETAMQYTLDAAGNIQAAVVTGLTSLIFGDYVEAFIENNTGTDNFTVTEMNVSVF